MKVITIFINHNIIRIFNTNNSSNNNSYNDGNNNYNNNNNNNKNNIYKIINENII